MSILSKLLTINYLLTNNNCFFMKEKETYSAPEVECIVTVREMVILAGSGTNRSDNGYDDGNDLGEI